MRILILTFLFHRFFEKSSPKILVDFAIFVLFIHNSEKSNWIDCLLIDIMDSNSQDL